MAKNKFRIGADVTGAIRQQILDRFPPRFATVWAKAITMVYNVTDEYEFSSVPVEVEVCGHHVGDGHEALIVRVDGEQFRPDGKHYHITLSTADGVPPAAAGDIKSLKISYLPKGERIRFQVKFFRHPVWVMKPTKKAA